MTKEQVPPQNSQDRRSSDERRAPKPDEVETERRTSVARRLQPDRRGIYSSIKYTRPEAVEELRQWLEANCEGDWTIGIPDTETAAAWGNFRVRFERQSDLSKLVKMLGVYWPSWMG